MKWPEEFPDNCPPEDAKPAKLQVFMLVSSPIQEEDFTTLHHRKPNQVWPNPKLECQANGLSVFERVEHLKRVQNRVARLRGHLIGKGDLLPEYGVTKPTHSQFGNSHRTWWVPVAVNPWELFRIVEEQA